LFKFPLSAGEKKNKKGKYIKSTNYFFKVQFTYKNNKQQQQTKTPTHNPKGKRCGKTSVTCDDLTFAVWQVDLVS
jgi:hypothetical protein